MAFFPNIPAMALTATAQPHLSKSIEEIYYTQLFCVFENDVGLSRPRSPRLKREALGTRLHMDK